MKPGNFGTVMDAFVAGRETMPFQWGPNDCASFPADLGVAAGLPDFLEGLRGYDSAITAASTLQAAGYADMLALATDRLERVTDDDDEPSIAFAQTGDIAVYENAGMTGIYRYTFAVCRADGLIMGPGAKGLVIRPKFKAGKVAPVIAAFRLG
jgi:hypothetical protein